MICTYEDHAEEEEVQTSSLLEKIADTESSEQTVFPVKLHNMLSEVEKQGLGNGEIDDLGLHPVISLSSTFSSCSLLS